MIVLATDRMALRRLVASDVDDLVELDSDPEVMRYINGGRPTPRDVVRDQLTRLLGEYERSPGYGRFAAIDRCMGAFLGWFGCRAREDRSGEADVGWRLRRAVWGRGLATEGARAVVRRAFTEIGALSVFAQTMTVNMASRRVMEKCGMRFVRTFFLEWPDVIPGAEHGDVEYALDRDEWERLEVSSRAVSRTAPPSGPRSPAT